MKKTSKTKKANPLARFFDEADPNEIGSALPTGEHVATIVEAGIRPRENGSMYGFIKFEGTESNEGKTITTYYNLLTEDGSPDKGLPYLKRDLANLGFPDIAGDDLESTLEELPEEVGEVSINVVQNGKYTNCYINGLADESAQESFFGEDDDDENDAAPDDDEDDDIPMDDEDEDVVEDDEDENDEDEDDEDKGDDEDEEDFYTIDDIKSMDKEELIEIIDENELAVDIRKNPTLAKLRKAVIAELGLA